MVKKLHPPRNVAPAHSQTLKLRFLPLLLCAFVAAPLAPKFARAQTEATAMQSQEKPFLHALFSDDAVLQRDRAIPVWGWTTPGQIVTVKLDDKTTTARADASGRWTAQIGPYPAGGPHTLNVSDANPADSVTRHNILFGDVWLCSGQSNMEFGIGNLTNAAAEIAAANYPNIRLFTVPKNVQAAPIKNVDSQWLQCNPTNIKQGAWNGFSAVAYFFGRDLNRDLNVPIGLIHSSWGGTVAQAWTSASSLGTMPDFQQQITDFKTANAPSAAPLDTRINQWLAKINPQIPLDWATPQANDANWKTENLPEDWEKSGVAALTNFDGVVLYRREVDVPAEWAGQDLTLELGNIDDNDTTYWNGARVGSTPQWDIKRNYQIPGAQVKAGRNVIAVRMTDTGGVGGFVGAASDMKLSRAGAAPMALSGAWKYFVAAPLAKAGAMPGDLNRNNPNQVDVLYNGMIAPLEPFALKGAIWYQGESNEGDPAQYARLLPTMIRDWRGKFGEPLPFYIVQLAGFKAPDDAPSNDAWPRLRAAQMLTAQTVPNTGIAITTDIGDEKDIHPKDKQDVGKRLALVALAKTYGKNVEFSGPTVKSVKAKGDALTINFAHAEGGLSLKGDDANRVFAVAGADRNWFWATPRIEGQSVILTSPMVKKPKYARYAWSNLPRATLYNGAQLPAPPFQTLP